ncbi:MAG TPA: EAL domain-containing protein, partial [Rubrivivax sp.]|nr:EAL domain-containing protein [Rubrivivax sp.]
NVSMDNLRRLDFPERVLARLAEHALAPSDLLLEVTESRLMSDPRAAFDILTRLRLHGVGLAIDDFGTGHSSLVQLRDLPFDELKIDRGFVRRCGELASHHTIVKASAAMASQLGMRSVAEGVEDHADWEAARAAGCDVAQGYYISRPMAGELLPLWAQSLAWRRAVGRDPDDAGGPPDDASRRAA